MPLWTGIDLGRAEEPDPNEPLIPREFWLNGPGTIKEMSRRGSVSAYCPICGTLVTRVVRTSSHITTCEYCAQKGEVTKLRWPGLRTHSRNEPYKDFAGSTNAKKKAQEMAKTWRKPYRGGAMAHGMTSPRSEDDDET